MAVQTGEWWKKPAPKQWYQQPIKKPKQWYQQITPKKKSAPQKQAAYVPEQIDLGNYNDVYTTNGGQSFTNRAGNVQGAMTYAGPSAAEIAAAQQKAADDAKRNKLRGEGNSYIDQLMGLYDQIVTAIQATGADATIRINKNYDGKVLDQHELMNDGMYQTDAANAAANLANSSWKAFDRGKVRKAKEANVKVLDEARGNDLATIGKMVNEDTARYNADKEGLGRTRRMLGETEDINELTGTVNTLDSSVRGTKAAQAKYGTQGEFTKKANSLGNYDTTTLEKTMQTIVANTSASPEAKGAAMDDLLGTTPLNDEQKKQLKNKYQQVI